MAHIQTSVPTALSQNYQLANAQHTHDESQEDQEGAVHKLKANTISRSSTPSVDETTKKLSAADSLATKNHISSTTLHRSAYPLLLVTLYSTAALFAWIITCILSQRPITVGHYGVWVYNSGKRHQYYQSGEARFFNRLFIDNEKWYRTARVVQAFVGVLAIPLTSAVCSSAAVIFVQRNRSLTLRKLLVLADKGWTDPVIYKRSIVALVTLWI